MRDRHLPRLCETCASPMARQEAACWSCGTQWASEDVHRPALRVIAGGADRDEAAAPDVTPDDADGDRWIVDGGSFGSAAAAQMRISTARR